MICGSYDNREDGEYRRVVFVEIYIIFVWQHTSVDISTWNKPHEKSQELAYSCAQESFIIVRGSVFKELKDGFSMIGSWKFFRDRQLLLQEVDIQEDSFHVIRLISVGMDR